MPITKNEYADGISVRIGSREQNLGAKTEVGTLARMAAAHEINPYEVTKYKLGDQVEWEIVLKGRTTVDKRLLDDVIESSMR